MEKINNKNTDTLENNANNKKRNNVSEAFLHTYQGDVDMSLKNKKTSLIRLMEKKTGEKLKFKNNINSTSISIGHAVFLSALFIIVGVFAIYISNKIESSSNQARVFFKSINKKIVLFDTKTDLDITGLSPYSIKQLIANSIPYKPPGTLLEIGLHVNDSGTARKISVDEFFERLGLSLGKEYISHIDDYFIGAFYDRFGAYPVLLFSSKKPNIVMYGIRKWEYKAPVELTPVFVLNTKSPTELFGSDIKYIDTAIDNVDIRVLPNKNGDPIIIYGILDQNIIFMTNSTDAIKEINRRLQYN